MFIIPYVIHCYPISEVGSRYMYENVIDCLVNFMLYDCWEATTLCLDQQKLYGWIIKFFLINDFVGSTLIFLKLCFAAVSYGRWTLDFVVLYAH